MRFITSTLILLFLFSNICSAQNPGLKNTNPKLGIQGGVNLGALWGAAAQEGDKGQPGLGLNAGIYTYHHIIGDIDFKTGINYSYNGVSFDSERELIAYPVTQDGFEFNIDAITETKGEVNLHYFEIPLEFILNFGDRFAMLVGPRIAYLASGRVEGDVQPYIKATLDKTDIEQLSDHISLNERALDWRVGLGFHYKLSAKTMVAANMIVGVNKVNSETQHFTDKLKNVFATTYIAYNIFGEYY